MFLRLNLYLCLFVCFLLVYVVLASGSIDPADAVHRFQLAQSFINTGSFFSQFDQSLFYTTRGGRFFTLGQVFLMIPFTLLGGAYAVSFLNCFFGALLCTLFFAICCNLGFRVKTSFILTLACGFSTLVFPYTKFLWDNIESCFFVLLAFYFFQKFVGKSYGNVIPAQAGILSVQVDKDSCFRRNDMWRTVSMIAGLLSAACACLIRLPDIIAFIVLGSFFFTYSNRKQRVGLICLTLFIGIFGLAYNYHSYGHFMGMFASLGLSKFADIFHNTFSTPWYMGLYGLYFSWGKSFFIYSPMALLGLFGFRAFYAKNKPLTLLSLLLILCYSAFYSKVKFWSGDHCWGPRYLLVLLPYFILPCGYLLESRILSPPSLRGCHPRPDCETIRYRRGSNAKTIFIVLSLLGFFINLPAILVHPINITHQYWLDYKIQNNFQFTDLVYKVYSKPQLSPVYLGWKAVWDVGERFKTYTYAPFTLEDQRAYVKVMRSQIKDNKGIIDKSALEPFLKKDLGYNVFYFWWVHSWVVNNDVGFRSRPFVLKFLAVLLSLFFLSSYLILRKTVVTKERERLQL